MPSTLCDSLVIWSRMFFTLVLDCSWSFPSKVSIVAGGGARVELAV